MKGGLPELYHPEHARHVVPPAASKSCLGTRLVGPTPPHRHPHHPPTHPPTHLLRRAFRNWLSARLMWRVMGPSRSPTELSYEGGST